MNAGRDIECQLMKGFRFADKMVIEVPVDMAISFSMGRGKDNATALPANFQGYIDFGVFLWVDHFHHTTFTTGETTGCKRWEFAVVAVARLVVIFHRGREDKPFGGCHLI